METVAISAAEVNELRKQTGAGLMDCKKALSEAKGDLNEAIIILRKKGKKIAESRSGKSASEGIVLAGTTHDEKDGYIIELNCESDFVAKNKEFITLTNKIMDACLIEKPGSLDHLLQLKSNGLKIEEMLQEKMAVIGEKIQISFMTKIQSEKVVSYVHPGSRLAVLAGFNKNIISKEVLTDVAMQIAAMNPISIDKNDVPSAIIQKEKEIIIEQVKQEGKPENIAEKIAEGKLQKFFKECTLLNQQFIKDNAKTIAQLLKETDKELKVTVFKRKQLGN